MSTFLDVLWVAAFCMFLFFCMTYHLLAPWWRSEVGRNIMTLKASITALLGLRVLAVIFGDGFWGQDLLRAVLLMVLITAGFHRWKMLVTAQRRRPGSDPEEVLRDDVGA